MKIFLDIETIPLIGYDDVETKSDYWNLITKKIDPDDHFNGRIFNKTASLNAEFGRVLCASLAYVKDRQLIITSLFEGDEKLLLNKISQIIQNKILIAHNGIDFDFPYLAKRMIVNNVSLPDCLNVAGKKPWEIQNIDTMKLWSFGSFGSRTSLESIAFCLGIESPKSEMSGEEVYSEFRNGSIDKIRKYCNNDVIALAHVYNRITGDKSTIFGDVIEK